MVTPMSPFSNIYSASPDLRAPSAHSLAAPETPTRGGPVLIGDISPQLGGRPLLLLLWEAWTARET